MMQTDVKGATCPAGTATTAFNGRTRLKSLAISVGTAAATVAVADGTTTLFTFTGTSTGNINVMLPGEGVLCSTSLIVTCAAGVSAVAFYG